MEQFTDTEYEIISDALLVLMQNMNEANQKTSSLLAKEIRSKVAEISAVHSKVCRMWQKSFPEDQ